MESVRHPFMLYHSITFYFELRRRRVSKQRGHSKRYLLRLVIFFHLFECYNNYYIIYIRTILKL